jgi:hypothetical protein
MKGKIKTHHIKLPFGARMYITLVKVYAHVHIFSAGLCLKESLRLWVTHVNISPTFMPFLKISTKTTTDI